MEKTKQKSKKEKPIIDKEKSYTLLSDVKTLKENLKIREILRSVKMNGSMRIKAPRGSKVMENKDFNENEELFDDTLNVEGQDEKPTSATNTVLNSNIDDGVALKENFVNEEINLNSDGVENEIEENDKTKVDTEVIHKSESLSEGLENCADNCDNVHDSTAVQSSALESPGIRTRERKLSLDHTMLSKRESLSQSEIDLHSIGKSPLERKSSFFRKKMDSFLKNTTEIFKRQSMSSKSIPSPAVQRRESTSSRMSISMQCLNENSVFNGDFDNEPVDKYHDPQGIATSLRSLATPAGSTSSLSVNVCDRPADTSEEGSQAGGCLELVGNQPQPDTGSTSSIGLNDSYMQDLFWNNRAISMSSGLDTATGQRRRKASKSNRVSWLASESLTDYFRRLIQDEKSQESNEHSYQDISSIPKHNKLGPRTDSKGRRLSYVRAVSGEDPVLSARSQDSSLRRKKNPEIEGNVRPEIETMLAVLSEMGIPPLAYTLRQICPAAEELLNSLDSVEAIVKHFKFPGMTDEEEKRQEILMELIYTEALHIRHLKVIVDVYIAAAHYLQSNGAFVDVNTSVLFSNIPDVLNSNIRFWEKALFPMLDDAMKNGTLFNVTQMIPGFFEFAKIFVPYEEYIQKYEGVLNYLRTLNSDQDFMTYLAWCDQQTENRLQLADMLVKPMQRVTKYTLIVNRLADTYSDEVLKQELGLAESGIKTFLETMNRSCRQTEEMNKLMALKIEAYEPDFKGDDYTETLFKSLSSTGMKLPMLGCAPHMMRCVIHEGDIRYKDVLKEFDAHVILLTDMILICKRKAKTSKSENYWKLQRPKILLHRTVPFVKPDKCPDDPTSLYYLILDELGCSHSSFQLSEPGPNQTMKVWEAKYYEAMITYTLTKWYYKYPVSNVAVIKRIYCTEEYKKEQPNKYAVEKKARERVAAMLFPNKYHNLPDSTRNVDITLTPQELERGPKDLHRIFLIGRENYNADQSRNAIFHQQIKGASNMELTGLPLNEPVCRSPSITINPVSDSESLSRQGLPSTLVLEQSSPNASPGSRSASAEGSPRVVSSSLLAVSPTHTKGHSMPDINAELHRPEPMKHIEMHTASEKLYRSHQELMRNKLTASHHFLSPKQRGSSYPPPSPTRPLTRGTAFNHPTQSKPPLKRTKNVTTMADIPRRSDPFNRQILEKISQVEPFKTSARHRSPSPSTSTFRASPHLDKKDLKE